MPLKISTLLFAGTPCAMVLVQSIGVCQRSRSYGTITGKVIDAETGEPLSAGNVIVLRTRAGAATDGKGIFRILIPAGTYTLQSSYFYYNTDTIAGVRVRADSVVHVDIPLRYQHADTLYWQTLARRDLDSGIVRIRIVGLVVLDVSEADYKAIPAKYGFHYDSDCTGSPEGFELYNQIVNAHLDSLNGPGWQDSLKADFERAPKVEP